MRKVLFLRQSKLPCWQQKFEGVAAFAQLHDWRIQLVNGTDSPIRIPELLDFWHPDGCILEGASKRENLSAFGTTPLVCLDYDPKVLKRGISVVRHDSAAIARLAARELLSLGYAHAAVLGWSEVTYWQTDKIRAFREACSLNGLPMRICRVLMPESNREILLHQELRDTLAKLPKPCGIFGVHDAIAGAALSAATSLGLAVPQELAFVGADDDLLICETVHPTLSSVRPDFRKSGEVAAELLQRKMKNPRRAAELAVIPPLGLVRRQSSKLLNLYDSTVLCALERIRLEAMQGLRASDVCADFHCSRRSAEIRFRKATGHSIMEEIQNVRFDRACELLREPDRPLGMIADLSGWPSSLVLSRYVKARTGKTLTELRMSINKAEEPT